MNGTQFFELFPTADYVCTVEAHTIRDNRHGTTLEIETPEGGIVICPKYSVIRLTETGEAVVYKVDDYYLKKE